MNDYLQGFNDGYKKAMEQMQEKGKIGICFDGKKIAEQIEPDITLLQKKKERTERSFRA